MPKGEKEGKGTPPPGRKDMRAQVEPPPPTQPPTKKEGIEILGLPPECSPPPNHSSASCLLRCVLHQDPYLGTPRKTRRVRPSPSPYNPIQPLKSPCACIALAPPPTRSLLLSNIHYLHCRAPRPPKAGMGGFGPPTPNPRGTDPTDTHTLTAHISSTTHTRGQGA